MKRIILIMLSLLLFASLGFPLVGQSADILLIPSQTLGLRHNVNQQMVASGQYMVFFSAAASSPVRRMDGGDLGAELHRGYEWWMILNNPSAVPATTKLPPGLVIGLAHSKNQEREGISVYGRPTLTGPVTFPGFKKQNGGDLGAPAGHGYVWYESTGEGFNNWSMVERLPKWTVLGLKHSQNQRGKKFVWNGKVYDPVNPHITPPAGFVRVFGGDLGAPAGQGYYWYEKITGPEIVVKPVLQVKLPRSLLIGPTDAKELDRDHDTLIDTMENMLANAFRPYVIFDSAEKARLGFEPVTLFQVRPVDMKNRSNLRVKIKWVFLFKNDGGYGPNSSCGDSHPGDNDDAVYDLSSHDSGFTWDLVRVGLSFKGLEWPSISRMEVYDLTHPIIYMSGSKHHEYFNRDYDHHNSRYSEWGCNDDVNGQGTRLMVDLQSVNKTYFNNVGEPESHPSPTFVDNLGAYYPGQGAWNPKNFYSVDSLTKKWMNHKWVK